MNSNFESKKAIVEEVGKALVNAQTMVLAEYSGVTVSALTELHANARKEGVFLHVVKNTLVRRAVKDTCFEPLAEKMVGPLIYAISEDAIAAAKVVHQFSQKDNKIVIKAGLYDGRLLDVEQISELACIPSREELLAKLLGIMQAPVSGFARALAALSAKKAEEA